MTKVVIGALSCQRDLSRRIRCRQCWAASNSSVEILFFIGDPNLQQPELRGDEVWLPCPDGYAELPQKTRGMCNWFLKHSDFEFLFKCDDDTYVCVDRLLAHPKQHDYIGHNLREYASGGAGYFLSRKAAAIVARDLENTTGPEDLLVGRLLKENGIDIQHDRGFGYWANWDEIPRQENDRITSHGWRDDRMLDIHREMLTNHFPRRVNDFCNIQVGVTAYGAIGIKGKLGFTVDETDDVAPPIDQTDWKSFELISGHTPSRILLSNSEPIELIGLMDLKSLCSTERPTQFLVNTDLLGECKQPGTRTLAIQLPAGDYVLETKCQGSIARRYAIWAIRKVTSITPPVHTESLNNELSECISFSELGRYGRLGNQLFQYALLCGVAQKIGCSIAIPDDALFAFNLLAYRVPRECLTARSQRYIQRSPAFTYETAVFEQPKGTDYHGFFQSYRYFEHIQPQIRQEYTFVDRIQQQARQLIDELRRVDSCPLVFVSVRRTDYLQKNQFHQPFKVDYFERAKQHFDREVRFVITSDDMNWVTQHLVGDNCVYLRHADPLVCLCIGTLCDHFISSAETYGWWAAWLCKNPNKKVVIPQPWYGPGYPHSQSNNHMSPPDWIREVATNS
jgi:hypothetical protein